MANQLCFTAAHETGNQQLIDNTQGLCRQPSAGRSKAAPKADSADQPALSLKEKLTQKCTKWAAKRGEQAVKNGWG